MCDGPHILSMAQVKGLLPLHDMLDVHWNHECGPGPNSSILPINIWWTNNGCLQELIGGIHDVFVNDMMIGCVRKVVNFLDICNIIPNTRIVFTLPFLPTYICYAPSTGQVYKETRCCFGLQAGKDCGSAARMVNISGIWCWDKVNKSPLL